VRRNGRDRPGVLSQSCAILLSNAIRYTRIGFVRLQCGAKASRSASMSRTRYRPVAEEYLPRIFDEFYQVGITPTRSGREAAWV
jgi:signal transduction histidine kinase